MDNKLHYAGAWIWEAPYLRTLNNVYLYYEEYVSDVEFNCMAVLDSNSNTVWEFRTSISIGDVFYPLDRPEPIIPGNL